MFLKLKKLIKNTSFYQDYRTIQSFDVQANRYEKPLSNEVNAAKRCCYYKSTKTNQIVKMMSDITISIESGKRFQSWIDTGLYVFRFKTMTDNIPPNYQLIIDNSLIQLKELYKNKNNEVAGNNIAIIDAVIQYIQRILCDINKKLSKANDLYLVKTKEYFENMLSCRAETLEEGFQRILFWSSLFWQSQHRLVGLGRLDKILGRLKRPDTEKETIDVICDFYHEVHRYYAFKSNRVSLGDTGQIIIIGGKESENDYFNNELSYLFIKALMKDPLPDPKILLRVSQIMPDDLLELGIKCISTGIGCPLLSNDDVVIPALKEFGYTDEDAYNYVTSACWEPLAYGRSLEKNNICDINFASAIVETYSDTKFSELVSFEELKDLFFSKLDSEIQQRLSQLDQVLWEADPLMSMFTEGCAENNKDISCGGAIYNDYGMLTVGLSNAVNSLLNLKKLIFDNRQNTRELLMQIKDAVINNYNDNSEWQSILSQNQYYGSDDSQTIDLVKQITDFTFEKCKDYRNKFGGKVKWGLSSSNYAEIGRITKATLDGRKDWAALATHISAPKGSSYTELVNFAGKLDYSGHRSNGNVVDFFVSPDFIKTNFNKFKSFITQSIKMGFFQMQMNVVSSKTLISAKNNPENFPI